LAAQLAGAAGWRPDALVPVPIHALRRLERGFNQSELLAGELGRLAGLPVVRALRRTRYTPPQVGRSRAERQTNLLGAFAGDPRRPVRGARVVLIDDVRTTGGTLSECAGVLRAGGASQVFALTVTYEP
jgi:ComF family protein